MGQLQLVVYGSGFHQERQRKLRVLQFHLRVSQVNESLRMIRIVGQLGLKLAHSLWVLPLCPQDVTQSEVNVGRLGIGLHRGAKLLDCGAVVLHLIKRFAGQHIGLGRLCIECQNLVVSIQNALILL